MAQLNPIKLMMAEMEKTCGKGVKLELQKKMPDGSVVPATESHLDAIDVHSSIASTAGSLQNMTHQQKTAWAISTKNYANALYENKLYKDAIIKYVECLTATRFGATMSKIAVEAGVPKVKGATSAAASLEAELGYNPNDADPESEENNVEEVVIPVLNNLIACSMRLYEYKKAKLFCEQLLKYAPGNYKGTYRLAQCHVRTGEYTQAIEVLDSLLQAHQGLQDAERAAAATGAPRPAGGRAAGGESANPATSEMDLSDAAVDDAEDAEEVLEMGADRAFELPDPQPEKKLTTVDYIRGLRRRALNGIEQERRNRLKQQKAMKAAFASKTPPPAPVASLSTTAAPPSTAAPPAHLSQGKEGGAVTDTAAASKKRKKTASWEDVSIVLLYVSVLMCLSAIIVRGIVHYIL